ncbi:MAG: PhoP regulatory network YrbL family protein [Puniceicoccales bacterium]|nr:PhoP regulatory network YrbL family protein [Puniceicoccales bacterium]
MANERDIVPKLTLKDAAPFAKGGHCLIFAHPSRPELVVRVINPEYIRKNNTLFRRAHFRRFQYHIDFLRAASEHIFSYLDAAGRPSFLQQLYCLVETDLGLAAVTRAERGADGGGMRFVVIDGLGEKTAIPLCSWFRPLNRRAKQRRIRDLRAQIAAATAPPPPVPPPGEGGVTCSSGRHIGKGKGRSCGVDSGNYIPGSPPPCALCPKICRILPRFDKLGDAGLDAALIFAVSDAEPLAVGA